MGTALGQGTHVRHHCLRNRVLDMCKLSDKYQRINPKRNCSTPAWTVEKLHSVLHEWWATEQWKNSSHLHCGASALFFPSFVDLFQVLKCLLRHYVF